MSNPPLQRNQTEQRDTPNTEQTKDPHSHCYCMDMRERFTALEGELVQLREMTLSLHMTQSPDQTSNKPTAKQKERDNIRKELSSLQDEVKQLQQERERIKVQLASLESQLTQQTESHGVLLTALREEIRELKHVKDTYFKDLNSTKDPVQQVTPLTEHSSQTSVAHPSQNLPSSPNPLPSTQPTSESDNASTPTENSQKTDIVLLIDSNGKFIDEKKLFPKHSVAKLWCPNTHSALRLLNEDSLGSPSHIIIHTGTNDLRAQQERVASALQRVIEKATTTFPNAKITISTLLPRKDFHPDTIQRVNANLSRTCALKPQVHLAHHPTLDLTCLYDHVHLYRATVPIFAKTLKDVALNRSTNTTPRSNRARQHPPRPEINHTAPTKNSQRPQPLPYHNNSQQTRTSPLLPTPITQHMQQTPGSLSYAQTVSRNSTPTSAQTPTAELKDIHQMLNLICSHLLS